MALPIAALATQAAPAAASAGGSGAMASMASSMGGPINVASKIAPAVIGAGQLFTSMLKKRKAKGLMPSQTDPAQEDLAISTKEKLKQIDAGTDMEPASDRIKQQGAGIARGIVNASGGASGSALSSLIKLNRGQGQTMEGLYAQNQANRGFYQSAYQQIIGDMASRRLDIQMLKYSQLMAEAAQAGKEGKMNLLGSLAKTGVAPAAQQAAPKTATPISQMVNPTASSTDTTLK